jgi:gliding motility-associated-like protein
MDVKVYIKDLCGNTEVIDCYVEVQDRKEIVKLEAFDVDSCVSDDAIVDLDAKSVVNYSGHIWRQVFGKWYSYTSRIFVDYYRGDVAAENLIYSNNKFTYGDDLKLDDKEALKLSRRSKSGRYAVVAMDTVAFCKDTVYFDVRLYERPRVSLDTGSIVVCEYDSIPLFQKDDTLSHRYNVCIDDMGAPITEEGWMLDGVVYKSKDSVYYTGTQRDLTYYADNRCGRTTSDDSYFFVCGGAQDYSAIDSFELLGNSRELLDLWRAEKLKSVDSIVVNVRERYKIDELVLTTKPQDKARVWRGEDADLVLKTNYKPLTYYWYRVEGLYDGRYGIEYDELGDVKTKYDNPMDVDDELLAVTHSFEIDEPFKYHVSQAMDTSMYYVVVTDSVCPALPSNLVRMDVLDQLPTAITPYVKDGMNDEFMPGYSVRIFNRYGQMLFEGEDGWDGTYRGMMADPGVYYYEVTMKNGVVNKGTVEVVKIE